VMGEPDLRLGSLVELGGLGRRFDGKYRITKVDHTYGSAGYDTSFDVERAREDTP
jgi:uncharacterized protein